MESRSQERNENSDYNRLQPAIRFSSGQIDFLEVNSFPHRSGSLERIRSLRESKAFRSKVSRRWSVMMRTAEWTKVKSPDQEVSPRICPRLRKQLSAWQMAFMQMRKPALPRRFRVQRPSPVHRFENTFRVFPGAEKENKKKSARVRSYTTFGNRADHERATTYHAAQNNSRTFRLIPSNIREFIFRIFLWAWTEFCDEDYCGILWLRNISILGGN